MVIVTFGWVAPENDTSGSARVIYHLRLFGRCHEADDRLLLGQVDIARHLRRAVRIGFRLRLGRLAHGGLFARGQAHLDIQFGVGLRHDDLRLSLDDLDLGIGLGHRNLRVALQHIDAGGGHGDADVDRGISTAISGCACSTSIWATPSCTLT